MTVGGSAGFGAWASAAPGASATTPAAFSRVRRVKGIGLGIDILRAKRNCTNRRLLYHFPPRLYHFHAAGAPYVPARPIPEVGKDRPRADFRLRAIGEDLELAVLEPRREVDRDRFAAAAAAETILQHQRVADVDREREGGHDDQRGDDDLQRMAAHRRVESDR